MRVFNGLIELLESPSGLFSLLCLAAISVVTWHSPSIGATAFVAFFGIVPGVLAYVEHKEQLIKLGQTPPSITTVINNVRNSITGDQPPNGDVS